MAGSCITAGQMSRQLLISARLNLQVPGLSVIVETLSQFPSLLLPAFDQQLSRINWRL